MSQADPVRHSLIRYLTCRYSPRALQNRVTLYQRPKSYLLLLTGMPGSPQDRERPYPTDTGTAPRFGQRDLNTVIPSPTSWMNSAAMRSCCSPEHLFFTSATSIFS